MQKRLNKEYVGQKDSHKNRSYVINLPENIEVETTFNNPFTFTPEEDPFFMSGMVNRCDNSTVKTWGSLHLLTVDDEAFTPLEVRRSRNR